MYCSWDWSGSWLRDPSWLHWVLGAYLFEAYLFEAYQPEAYQPEAYQPEAYLAGTYPAGTYLQVACSEEKTSGAV